MSTLSALHRRLNRLSRRRRRLCLGVGLSALAVGVLWAVCVAFLADWLLDMTRLQRAVVLVGSVAALAWAYRRFTRPWLRRRETELEMAMLIQRQEQIDSDLVAALQFERPEARQWGSVQLEQAVIDRAAGLGARLEVDEASAGKPLRRRVALLAVTAALVAVAAWRYPDHASTFLKRLALGSGRYPTRTVIEAVAVDGRRIDPAAWPGEPVKTAYGGLVRLEVDCSGVLPDEGRAELELPAGGPGATVPLSRDPARAGHYAGQLPRMLDSVSCRIFLGDARIGPGRIDVVLPPLIDLELEVTPPAYTIGPGTSPGGPTSLRQLSVVEGSRVEARATSTKPLRHAAVVIDEVAYPMARRTDGDPQNRDRWTLPADETPLAFVDRTIRYALAATDVDGLGPQKEIRGTIRIKADQLPHVRAAAVTRHVLPTATPSIWYDASDDYGVARLALAPQVEHADGTTSQGEPIVIFDLPPGGPPEKSREDRFRLDLGPLGVVPGDVLSVRVLAEDYRGRQQSGKSSASEPLVFDVTDQRGILAAMSESDRESARHLKDMIGRQIDVGEGP